MATKPELTKTGECFFREEDGSLWLAESFVDNKGVVTTQQMQIESAQEEDNG
jgi:hypothetical protein